MGGFASVQAFLPGDLIIEVFFMVFGLIPIDLIDKTKKDSVLIYIRDLPIEPEDKKRILVNWCKEVGAALDRDMVEKAGAE